MNRFIQIDEEGYFLSSGLRVTDESYGYRLLENLQVENRIYYTTYENNKICVEAFDEPYVAHHIEKEGPGHWTLLLPYDFRADFQILTLAVDEWDRFHGRTEMGVPFVLSRSAQMELFDLVDEFGDTSIATDGKRYEIPTLNELDKRGLEPEANLSGSEFWSECYRAWKSTATTPPGWDLGAPSKPLTEVLPQIKIPKSRICVLGSGSGYDAAHLASLGHIVTAVDISGEAIEKAKSLHPESQNLQFMQADAFALAQKSRGEFDVIFEHTLFCAIDPDRRDELIKVWRSLLADDGHLLGVFFAMDRSGGPPFGASEWELRERLRSQFIFLYWTRWKTSIESRRGRELIIYARKN